MWGTYSTRSMQVIHTYIHACICNVCICMYHIHINICIYIYTYMYTYIYIYQYLTYLEGLFVVQRFPGVCESHVPRMRTSRRRCLRRSAPSRATAAGRALGPGPRGSAGVAVWAWTQIYIYIYICIYIYIYIVIYI